jgi:hypothetical protein
LADLGVFEVSHEKTAMNVQRWGLADLGRASLPPHMKKKIILDGRVPPIGDRDRR